MLVSIIIDQVLNIWSFRLSYLGIIETNLILKKGYSDNLLLARQNEAIFFNLLLISKFFFIRGDVMSGLTELIFFSSASYRLYALFYTNPKYNYMFKFIQNQIQKIKSFFKITNYRSVYKNIQTQINKKYTDEQKLIVNKHFAHYIKPAKTIKIANLNDVNFK